MSLPRLAVLAPLPWLVLASCSSTGGGSGSAGGAAAAANSMAEAESPMASQGFRSSSGGGDDSLRMEQKYASRNPLYDKNGQRKQVQSLKEFTGANKEFGGENKEFKTDLYQKKSFWGDKEYATKVYGGETDGSRFMKDSRFGGKKANEGGGMAARDAAKQFATNDYATGNKSARESGRSEVTRKSDAEVDHRREVSNEFAESPMLSWKEQRALSVQETRKLLGRDKSN